jgi:hypothetical protein
MNICDRCNSSSTPVVLRALSLTLSVEFVQTQPFGSLADAVLATHSPAVAPCPSEERSLEKECGKAFPRLSISSMGDAVLIHLPKFDTDRFHSDPVQVFQRLPFLPTPSDIGLAGPGLGNRRYRIRSVLGVADSDWSLFSWDESESAFRQRFLEMNVGIHTAQVRHDSISS